MTVSFQDLLTPATEDEIETSLLALLGSGAVGGVEFPVTSWQPGGVARTIVKLVARGLASIAILVALIGRSGFVKYAQGAWLTLTASQYFSTERKIATFAQGVLTLESVAGSPYTIAPQQLAFGWNSLVYRNVNGGVLGAGGTLLLQFQAFTTGSNYNAPVSGVNKLLTPLAGVSIRNNLFGNINDPPGTWWSVILVQGADEERDDALALRAIGRWGTTGVAADTAGYATWATTASTEITRVAVAQNTPDFGHVTVVVAGDTGAPSGGAVTDVDAYINGPPKVRRPLCVTVHVAGAVDHTINVTATLYVKSGLNANAKAQAEKAIVDYSKTLPIATAGGGWTVPGGVTVFRDKLIAALESPVGIVNSVLTVPGADVNMAANEVPKLIPVITVSLV